MLLVGSCNGIFRALARHTGRVLWETRLASGPEQYFFHGDPLVTGDTVVVGADSQGGGGIHALDRATGRQRWKFPADRGVLGPIVGNAQRAYAAAPGELVSLDIGSGTVTWRFPLKVPGWEGPAMVGARVYAGSIDGSLYALDAATGQKEWQVALGAPVTTSVGVFETSLYVGTDDGRIHRVDAASGRILGAQRLDDALRPSSVPVPTRDGLLVLLTDPGAEYRGLVSLDFGLESVRWRQDTASAWSISRVFVHERMALLGASSGEVLGYCTADGTKAWSATVRGNIRAIGGAADAFYVGTRAGTLHALRSVSACAPKEIGHGFANPWTVRASGGSPPFGP